MTVTLLPGDCLALLPMLASASIDSIVSDPPYAEVDRPYGRLTEAAWMDLMQAVTRQARRLLKPTGSALFIVQPNSAHIGMMRLWVWDFLSWVGREWNIVQDAYWWNTTAMPTAGATRARGLMRPSVKYCIWLGAADCYRNQDAVLLCEADRSRMNRINYRYGNDLQYRSSDVHVRDDRARGVAVERGGVTPFNILPLSTGNGRGSAGDHGHSAGTPRTVAAWWQRYLTPPRGVTCDPFMGAGTMGITAIEAGYPFIGMEKDPDYYAIAERRIAAAQPALLQEIA